MSRPRKRRHPLASTRGCFHYSAYWGKWSRVLTSYVDGNGTLELNLTPINPGTQGAWDEQVVPVMFRNHRTSLDEKDKLQIDLPSEVRETMVERLGEVAVVRLLTTDFILQLDMPTVRMGRYGGGGIRFDWCRKETAHISLNGRCLCGMEDSVRTWPSGHTRIDMEAPGELTSDCLPCRAEAFRLSETAEA